MQIDFAAELMDLARRVEAEAEQAARPGQLDRLDAIANRLRALSGAAGEVNARASWDGHRFVAGEIR